MLSGATKEIDNGTSTNRVDLAKSDWEYSLPVHCPQRSRGRRHSHTGGDDDPETLAPKITDQRSHVDVLTVKGSVTNWIKDTQAQDKLGISVKNLQ